VIESAVTKLEGIREVVEEWESNALRRNLPQRLRADTVGW